ncbi:MAG: SDR family oxidoreductase [Bradyrhizobium sp.]
MRCLIIGADGSIGGALAHSLGAHGHGVVTTTRRTQAAARDTIFLDLAGPLPDLPEVDVAVICAAMARLEECRRDVELARQVNVTAPLELGRSLARAGARVILLSTAAVFDGNKGHVEENEQPKPRSAYGLLKAEAEARMLDLGSLASVLRLTKVVKPNAGIFSQWIAEMRDGKTVRALSDRRLSPLTVAHAVDASLALIENGKGGIYHASGATDVSYADAARFVAQRIGVAADRVEAVRAVESHEAELMPFTSLATGRLSRLSSFVPPGPLDVLRDVYGDEIAAARQARESRAAAM